jgi:hypothetical protein
MLRKIIKTSMALKAKVNQGNCRELQVGGWAGSYSLVVRSFWLFGLEVIPFAEKRAFLYKVRDVHEKNWFGILGWGGGRLR